jgi:acyl carrier protein
MSVVALYPFGRAQLGMLAEILTGEGGMHVEQLAVTLPEPVEPDLLRRAWAQQVAAHEALRTCAVVDGVREPVFCVLDAIRAVVHEPCLDEAPAAWCEQERCRRFDLEQAPLARLALLNGPLQVTTLVLTYSHLILDGWSVRLLMTGLRNAYRRLAAGDMSLPPVDDLGPVRAHLQRAAAGAGSWLHDRLSGVRHATHPLAPPGAGRGRAGDTAGHHDVARAFTSGELESVRRAAHHHRVGMVGWLQATWAVLLQARTKADPVVFGVTATVRPPQIEGIETLVGMLVATVPMAIARAASVAELLAEVRTASLRLPEVAGVAVGEAPAITGLPAGMRLYESVVVSQFAGAPQEGEAPLPGGTMTATGARTRHALVILISGSVESPTIRMVGRTRHYGADLLGRLLDDFFRLACALASLPPQAPPALAAESLPQQPWWHARLAAPVMADPLHGSVGARVHACWHRVCGEVTPQPDELPWDAFGVSSMALVHLKAEIEQTFGIVLPLAELARQQSLGAIAVLVERHLAAETG